MLLHSLTDVADGSNCTLCYEEENNWLRATWRGFVDTDEAQRGATSYLKNVGGLNCACLLNDNSQLQGPWFDSRLWLDTVWLPHALALGLRYVAHVVQTDTHTDVLNLVVPGHLTEAFELQLFDAVPAAEDWLRSCQRQHATLPATAATAALAHTRRPNLNFAATPSLKGQGTPPCPAVAGPPPYPSS